ncbi:Sensor protein zraS [Fibrisoma limi BUZ 3]|uniref:histidine kinase n=1 Tax=Fibrisoma limi BUZ 3 TaxID=1185876 RepID=I2GK43_9BACT|nr:ATP-binding protein [Fibrisoma limi]CCH54268.1 Sensor protein zraS [Fibrisoma limi BUZ 3]
MKPLLLIWFLGLTSLTGLAQSVFRIDSLPQQGVVLDKNWRFHLGDDPAWAKPGFDDSRWDTLNPTQLVAQLNRLPQDSIGWLRIRLHISPALRGRLIGVNIQQAGAAELFLNGKNVHRCGVISSQKRIEVGSIYQYHVFISLGADSIPVLAIRYAFSKDQLLPRAIPSAFYTLKLTSFEVAEENEKYLSFNIVMEFALFGVFLGLGFLQLLLYPTATKQQTTLSLSLFLITQGVVHLLNGCSLSYAISRLFAFTNSLITYELSYIVWVIVIVISSFYYLIGTYQYFELPRKVSFWIVIALTFTAIPASLFLKFPYSSLAQYIPAIIIPFIEILRVGLLAVKRNRSGAILFTLAHGITLLVFLSWTISTFLPTISEFLAKNGLYLFSVCYLGLALTISQLLAQERASLNQLLRKQLVDLEVLSQKNLAQEQEKQQLLATQNERLEQQVEARTAELKASQAQLIQKEKLASLGELTAGIAHEIQNPLNFVNNFSEVSAELVGELKEELAKGDTQEAQFIADDLSSNLQKIHHHGGRAAAIVQGMLEHSRTDSGEKRPTDLNALADEYLKIAYHGFRAKDKDFNCQLVTESDPGLGRVEVVPQEIGRVLLNLYNNAFYAVSERQKQAGNDYHPSVRVTTKRLADKVEVQVSDNGTGIPESIKAKIFQPFFTTKPTGEGTGLGLSLSYDIVTKGHGGLLEVESREGEGTEFSISLPKHN